MEDKKKKDTQQADFIVEMPIIVEEKVKIDGKVIIRKYERGKFLGKGGFAKCYEMKCVETKKVYAAKLFEKKALSNTKSRKKLINEIKLHKKLHHQNIVNFEHFFEDKENVYILLELCSNQTLNELLKRRKRLTDIEIQCYTIQIIKALKYIHSHKIIHRDLKLGNLFVTNKLEVKLGDFGLAARIEYEGQRRKTVCGTPNYIAPEVLEKKNGHSYEVDVWSLGVIIYTLYVGRPPYETADVKLTYKRIKINNYSFPENIKIHYLAKRLISSILNLDPSKRPTLDQILDHDYFRVYASVPHVLPLSTLALPPNDEYLTQFSRKEGLNSVTNLTNSTSNLLQFDSYKKNLNSNTHRKSGSYSDFNNAQIGMNINGQIVRDNRVIDEEKNDDEENEENINNFLNELEKGDDAGVNNILYTSSLSKVISFYDYTVKFGYVYIISSEYNFIGICFNDFSSLILNISLLMIDNKNKLCYNYFDKDHKNLLNFDEIGFENTIKQKTTNKDFAKKCEIFKQIHQKYNNEISNLKPLYGNIDTAAYNINKVVFIKDFMKVQQATMFRLSNKLVQISFVDQTEILMSTESADFIFKNKNGEEITDSIFNGICSDNNDIVKRIKFAKSLMIYFVKTYKTGGIKKK